MPIGDNAALRGFVERLLGWDNPRAVEFAMRSLELAAGHRAALVLCGAGDMVPIARSLHRRAIGAERPFIVCDPRRGNTRETPRVPANRASGVAAFAAAVGGTLCVRPRRLPRDFPALAAQLRVTDDVLFIACIEHDDADPLLVRPAPIVVPPLASRTAELDRVIAEYAADATTELGAPAASFTAAYHAWVREHAATSLAEIDKATTRLVVIRTSRNMSDAAARLGMAPVSLSRWIDRRKLRRVLAATGRNPCRPT